MSPRPRSSDPDSEGAGYNAPVERRLAALGVDIEGDVVEVGLHTRRVLIRDASEVDDWRRLFERLAAQALRGEAAVPLLRTIDDWLAGLVEPPG